MNKRRVFMLPVVGDDRGFTLIEVMISMGVFIVGMTGIAAILISSVKGNDFAARATEASLLAANQMEQIMGVGYNAASLVDGVGTNDGAGGLNDGIDGITSADFVISNLGRNDNYTVMYNIANNFPVNNTKSVRVIATWSVKGEDRQIVMTGIRTGR